MDVLQKLRFGSGWVTTKEHINLTSESALGSLFRDTAKKLAEDALLDVVVFPDGRSKGVNQLIVHFRRSSELLELFDLLW